MGRKNVIGFTDLIYCLHGRASIRIAYMTIIFPMVWSHKKTALSPVSGAATAVQGSHKLNLS